jgi:4-hydroxy-2-oxoheptanedioate aldolase
MANTWLKQGNPVKKKIAAGESVYGTFVLSAEASFVEMIGYSGFDFVLIDTEHSPNTMEQVVNLVRAADVAGALPIVRVTCNSPELILRALDVGAGAVVVPQVNTALEAAAAVRAARYAPEGERGLAGIVRAAKYGLLPLDDYMKAANSETLVITQVEHIDAIKNLDEILAVEGLDGIFIGPADLSQSMGCAGQFQNPEFRQAIHSVIDKARRTDKWVGIFCLNAEDANYWKKAGAQLLTIGSEGMIFTAALRHLKKELRGQ